MDILKKEPLWTKNFIIVSLINFLVILIFYQLMVTIAEYAVEEYHTATSTAGLVSSIFIIGSLIGRLITGRGIVSLGSKKTFKIGLVLFTLTTLAYFIANNLAVLIGLRLLHGISSGVISTATGTVIAQIIPASRRGEGIGYYSMSAVLATAIGPFIGILLLQTFEQFSAIFVFNTILVVICIATSFFLNMDSVNNKISTGQAPEPKGFSVANYIEPKAVPISFIALLAGFAYSGIMSFLSFYMAEIDLVQAGSLFFLVYSISILLTRPITGPLMDRKGANIVVYPALILFAAGMVLFSEASTGVMLLASACIIGIGYGNFNSIAQALAIKGVEPRRMGLATSTYYILYDIGLGAGPFLLGALVPLMGYRSLFFSMVPVIIISLILYWALVGRRERKEALQTGKLMQG
ncbi:MFS transporter [Mesobacillus foraminis]|uniref:MFS transporter n=1 Tax=Mesobacillus foraminis TaxID=279826 RepID=UPI001BEBAA61|nr:MFS transporter [Mesobacillus foraminis]MBT2756933.1 MFS transporter [Mesobacillus foraminis]